MYKDYEEYRVKHLEWVRVTWIKRRQEWFAANGPCRMCGSWDQLEVNHIDPSQKVTERFWFWREDRRVKELAKCEPLCHSCHLKVSAEQRRKPITHGIQNGYRRGCRCEQCVEVAQQAHREKHLRRKKVLGKTNGRSGYRIVPLVHGSYSGYATYKCRCSECRAANAKRAREARQRARSRAILSTIEKGGSPERKATNDNNLKLFSSTES